MLIKNIELPPMGKQICLWIMHNGTVWHEDARDMIPTVMEAIPVPEHGDLIDRDKLISKIETFCSRCGADCIECQVCRVQDFANDAKVVLEASNGSDS